MCIRDSITTYAALNELNMQSGTSGDGVFDRLLARLPKRWLQRPLVLAVRNTLRHKGRLLRTMIVMILGTSLFIAVISVRVSVDTTQSDFLRYHQDDVQVQVQEAHRIARLEPVALAAPGVVSVESVSYTHLDVYKRQGHDHGGADADAARVSQRPQRCATGRSHPLHAALRR